MEEWTDEVREWAEREWAETEKSFELAKAQAQNTGEPHVLTLELKSEWRARSIKDKIEKYGREAVINELDESYGGPHAVIVGGEPVERWEKIGEVEVDSGLVMIVDPCRAHAATDNVRDGQVFLGGGGQITQNLKDGLVVTNTTTYKNHSKRAESKTGDGGTVGTAVECPPEAPKGIKMAVVASTTIVKGYYATYPVFAQIIDGRVAGLYIEINRGALDELRAARKAREACD
jgi:hypothetical protein